MTQKETIKLILAQMDIVRSQTWVDEESRSYALGHLFRTIEAVMGVHDATRNSRFRTIEKEYRGESA
jgi:hypothetical protein